MADDHDAIQPAGAQASQAPEGRSGQEELIPAGKIPKHLVKPGQLILPQRKSEEDPDCFTAAGHGQQGDVEAEYGQTPHGLNNVKAKSLVKPQEEVAGLQEESEILEQGKRIRIPLSFDAMDDKATPIAGGRGKRSIGDDVNLTIITGDPGEEIREHPIFPPPQGGA